MHCKIHLGGLYSKTDLRFEKKHEPVFDPFERKINIVLSTQLTPKRFKHCNPKSLYVSNKLYNEQTMCPWISRRKKDRHVCRRRVGKNCGINLQSNCRMYAVKGALRRVSHSYRYWRHSRKIQSAMVCRIVEMRLVPKIIWTKTRVNSPLSYHACMEFMLPADDGRWRRLTVKTKSACLACVV